MVKHEVVKYLTRILKEELSHLDTISESVKRDFGALSNSDELLFFILDTMTAEKSKRLEVLLECVLVNKVHRAKTSRLHVEELGSVEDSFLLFTCHLVKEVSVVGVLHKLYSAVAVFVGLHVRQHIVLLLFGAYPG